MSNKVIIAAAGSGKTTHLIDEAIRLRDASILISTFTDANAEGICNCFIHKNKCIPSNVTIQTWFSFLLKHGVKPYQGYLYEGNITGLFLHNGQSRCYSRETEVEKHYLTKDKKIFSDKIAKFVYKCDEKSRGIVIHRLSQIYTHIFIDEIQDLAGYDLEILKKLFRAEIDILLVGDPRQGTYSTNNSAKNRKFNRSNILNFFIDNKKNFNLDIDSKSLNVNHRSILEICNFSNKLFPDMPATTSDNNVDIGHKGIFFVRTTDVEDYLKIYRPVQLRQDKKTPTCPAYPCLNFGNSKGLSFDRVLIYPTQPILDWILKGKELAPMSKSKFYVAITRARYSVAIVYDYKDNTRIDGIINYK